MFKKLKGVMYLLTKKSVPLTTQYLYYSSLVIAITVIISLLVSFSAFYAYRKEHNLFLSNEAYKLSFELEQNISYIRNISVFLASKIIESGDFSLENIAFLLHRRKDLVDDDVVSWTLMDYVNPKKQIVVDSERGVLNTPRAMQVKQRPWLIKACKEPWKLYFSLPDYGMISQEMVISTGLGITDDDKNFIGYLSTNLNLKKLRKSMRKVIDANLDYIVLDKNSNFIASSANNFNKNELLAKMQKMQDKFEQSDEVKLLTSQIIEGNNIYTHMAGVQDTPYIILIGENLKEHYKHLTIALLPQILRNIFIGLFGAGVLLYLGYRIARPIIELGKIADKISKGRRVTLPEYKIKELDTLAAQLSSIQAVHDDLSRNQNKLLKANHELETANNFIRSNMLFLSHELRNPLTSLIGFIEILQKSMVNVKDKAVLEIIDIVHKIATYQDKQIDFFLRFCEFQEKGKAIEQQEIELKELIQWNVSMVRHHAKKQEVEINIDCSDKLPKIIGDKLMLGQMIQNFVTNGIKYNKRGGSLFVKAFTRYHNRKKELLIQFKDTGIGISQQDINKIFEKFERIKTDRHDESVGYGIGLNYVKNCIILHDAKIEVQSKVDRGSTFTIIFPRSRIMEE